MPPCTWMLVLAFSVAASSASILADATARGRVADLGVVERDGGGVHRDRSDLRPHVHVGAHVLDGLERADGPAELLALLGVLHRQLAGRPWRCRSPAPPSARRLRDASAPARRRAACRPAAQRSRRAGSADRWGRRPGWSASSDASMSRASSPSSTTSLVMTSGCSTSSVRPGSSAERSKTPTGAPTSMPGRPAASSVPTSGPGTSARPSSSKTSTASPSPRPRPPSLSGSSSPKTPSSVRVGQSVGVEAGTGRGELAEPLAGERVGADLADPGAQRLLILGGQEIHPARSVTARGAGRGPARR